MLFPCELEGQIPRNQERDRLAGAGSCCLSIFPDKKGKDFRKRRWIAVAVAPCSDCGRHQDRPRPRPRRTQLTPPADSNSHPTTTIIRRPFHLPSHFSHSPSVLLANRQCLPPIMTFSSRQASTIQLESVPCTDVVLNSFCSSVILASASRVCY